MKRWIILLLVLVSFKSYSAEELSAEQQQSAWNFIYENMLYHFYLPNIFHNDIKINLVGKVTKEDSIIVEDIINNVKKAIPHQKIELTKDTGNLVLWINSKQGSFNSKTKDFGEINIARVHIQIPDSYSLEQRKRFIYYNFLRGGLILYAKPRNSYKRMEGCVFSEPNFESITFSPFDLFILEKLYAPDFSIQLANNLSPELQHTAWNSIKWLFMGKPNDPLTFNNYIFIKLLGEISHKDSVCFKKLTDELNKIIPQKNQFIYTDKEANLTFSINTPGVKSRQVSMNNGENITIREIDIYIPENANEEERLTIIYFYLYRSLVYFSPTYGGSQKVEGCVFDETEPKYIHLHPIDKFILSKLYAPDFQRQFKSYYLKSNSLSEYYKFRFKDKLAMAGIGGGIILSILLISILTLTKIFRKHQWKFKAFMAQVFWGIIAYDVFFLFNRWIQELSFSIDNTTLYFLLVNDLVMLLVCIIFYFIERKIQFSCISSTKRTFLLLINTITISYISSFLFFHFIARENGYGLIFLPIFFTLIITTARFFFMSLSGINKAEMNEKENEILLLREKNKQAELQSIRAKINPHFLYNALNSIASLATTDGHKTEQMALSLSDFFKYAINREQKQMNTLSEELNAIRTYLEIEKVRFGERLNFEIECPSELLDFQIPQLLIQPLVENAIKHGLSKITDKGFLRVSVSKESNQLKIRVYDNGPAFPDGPLSGFGIQNTQERITLIYGAKAGINWQNSPEKYIEIDLPLNNN
jgi:sensor histidine kinase YesM